MRAADLVVVGAGHAGCEAAAAAARMGLTVALITLDRRTTAQMPCNPAVGGIGKGHLVAELDALGGLQGWAADRAGIQFKTLNRSRGPAVWGPRAQCDKIRYATIMRRVVERLTGVTLVEGEVEGLVAEDRGVTGVRLAGGRRVTGRAVLLTTGTFLGGLLHTGEDRRPGGRFGERPSSALGAELRALGLELRRFKTGTPPRLSQKSLNLDGLEQQAGDAEPRPFSWRTRRRVENRCVCWVARTPIELRDIIRENIHRSPLFSGEIDGVGPRYCPSIEDKVVRFPHHERHLVFLEPEGLDSDRMYVNGLSTSLPTDVQERFVRSIQGLERAEFLQYGYAVEYDVVAPLQITTRLAARGIDGLYVAGQLIGTSGYEEAAALGLLAGINIARNLRGEEPFVPPRENSYLGVLVDDVCGREHREPYRMFTSRAEHRLVLGVDSARERMMPQGRRLGLIPDGVFHVEQARWRSRRRVREELENTPLNPDVATRAEVLRVAGIELSGPATWAQILRRQDVAADSVAAQLPQFSDLGDEDRRIVIGQLRYAGYLARSERERQRIERLRHAVIPADLDVTALPGLSREIVEAMEHDRPRTLADAERIPGMTPAALSILAARIGSGK